LTGALPLRTRDTVIVPTPANFATSLIFAFLASNQTSFKVAPD
jgi:hypothetical protein